MTHPLALRRDGDLERLRRDVPAGGRRRRTRAGRRRPTTRARSGAPPARRTAGRARAPAVSSLSASGGTSPTTRAVPEQAEVELDARPRPERRHLDDRGRVPLALAREPGDAGSRPSGRRAGRGCRRREPLRRPGARSARSRRRGAGRRRSRRSVSAFWKTKKSWPMSSSWSTASSGVIGFTANCFVLTITGLSSSATTGIVSASGRRGPAARSAAPALVAVASRLTLELLHEHVDRGAHVRRALARPQDGALRPDRRLRRSGSRRSTGSSPPRARARAAPRRSDACRASRASPGRRS